MRIVEHFDLLFCGVVTTQESVSFEVQDDSGVFYEIQIPNYDVLIKTFKYMSDNDCLRHLVNLEPQMTTNIKTIEETMEKNRIIEEDAWALNNVSKSIDPVTLEYRYYVPGLITLPQHVWEARWIFRSKQHAVMTKLARGGRQ